MNNSKTNAQLDIEKLLIHKRKPIEIGVDAEFQHAHTLTIQVAHRLTDKLVRIGLYRSQAIPEPSDPASISTSISTESYERYCKEIELLPIKQITSDLSPAQLIIDILGLQDAKPVSRSEGAMLLRNREVKYQHSKWNKKRKRWIGPTITLKVVGHFLQADFSRISGVDFFYPIIGQNEPGESTVCLKEKRTISFAAGSHVGRPPVIQYLQIADDFLCAIRVETCDLMFPFDSASLDKHSHTFLGLGKDKGITVVDKQQMLNTFKSKIDETYKYAVTDALNTLLIYEQMALRDRKIYEAFNVPVEYTPDFKGTCGKRISDFLETMARLHAKGSLHLTKPLRSLKTLIRRGGFGPFRAQNSVSRYGEQTAKIYGGLTMSRSPTKFFHEAPGMLRDLDMTGCYNSIVSKINVYCGKPIVLEPGARNMTLEEAVSLVEEISPSDGYYITVTGDFHITNNTLLLSTVGAKTFENYRSRQCKEEHAAMRVDIEDKQRSVITRLFSKRVEQGVVTYDLWTLIKSLPKHIYDEYARLRVESIVFYHKELIAHDDAHYDQLYDNRFNKSLPWSGYLVGSTELVNRVTLDHEYVSLRIPINDVASQLGKLRDAAKEMSGKGSGDDLALKIQANSMYGLLGSKFHKVANVVAANVVTARARTEAYIMMTSLNGLQVITDGCSYRRDRIPSCSFEECLHRKPDYCLQIPSDESSIPFHDPVSIPLNDSEFTEWYFEHAMHFFGDHSERFRSLVSTHTFEHKITKNPDRDTFDAMTTDGSANYIKLIKTDCGYEVVAAKMRGYRSKSKVALEPFIIETYRNDRMVELPPILEDTELLKLDQAFKVAGHCLTDHPDVKEVLLPLGFELKTYKSYKIIKPSAFIFQTPKQFKAIMKAMEKLQRELGSGLDMILLRHRSKNPEMGTLTANAESVYAFIQSGSLNFSRKFNLDQLSKVQTELLTERMRLLEQYRNDALRELFGQIDVQHLQEEACLTGIVVNRSTLQALQKP